MTLTKGWDCVKQLHSIFQNVTLICASKAHRGNKEILSLVTYWGETGTA